MAVPGTLVPQHYFGERERERERERGATLDTAL
jgi:hypothetical protein